MNAYTSATKIQKFGRSAVTIRNLNGLSDEEIGRWAPTVFAEEKHSSRSEKYVYIPTKDALAALRREGFVPTEVVVGGSKDEEKLGYTKHRIRLRQADFAGADVQQQVREMARQAGLYQPGRHESIPKHLRVASVAIPEVLLANAHDGTSAYQLSQAAYRMVCYNGLILCEAVEVLRVRHSGKVIDDVIEGTFRVIEESTRRVEQVAQWQGIELNRDERQVLAEAALIARFGEEVPADLKANPQRILEPRRQADVGGNLWLAFNRAQENLVERGGPAYVANDAKGRKVHRHVRPVRGVDSNTNINRALFHLANEMAKLKQAA